MYRYEIIEIEYNVLRQHLKLILGQDFEETISDFVLHLISQEQEEGTSKKEDTNGAIQTRMKKAIGEMRKIAKTNAVSLDECELAINEIAQQMQKLRRLRTITEHFEAQFHRDQISNRTSLALFSSTFRNAVQDLLL